MDTRVAAPALERSKVKRRKKPKRPPCRPPKPPAVLICSDKRVHAFGFRFQRNTEPVPLDTEMTVSADDLETAKSFRWGGDLSKMALWALLEQRGGYCIANNLWFRTGRYKLFAEADGIFKTPLLGQTIAVVNRAGINTRMRRYAFRDCLQRSLRFREKDYLTPANEEEDPQIAGLLAALAQQTWGLIGGKKSNEPGIRVHAIWYKVGVQTNVYSAWFSREAIKTLTKGYSTLRCGETVDIEYQTMPALEPETIVRQICGWMREKGFVKTCEEA